MALLLEMRSIVKRYPGVLALDHANFDLHAGEVHCLVGENGAGKSTLMKILSGALPMDEGIILLDGNEVEIDSPAKAQRLGIGTIHQEFKLVPSLSVAENILLGSEPTTGAFSFVDKKQEQEIAHSTLSLLGEEFDTTEAVDNLGAAQRQLVEIAKALSKRTRIIAMDEPTASLTESETVNLFRVIQRLKREGVGIIYISHRLDEIFEIADRVTVLRDGKVVNTCSISEADKKNLIRWMVGRELGQEYPRVERKSGKEILRLEKVNAGKLKDINLTLYQGEILGLAGLVGAGRSELARIIFGADPISSGSIMLDGKSYRPPAPKDAIEAGIGLLTEDRNRYGLIMQMSVEKNTTLANLRDVVRRGLINKTKEREVASEFIGRLQIKPHDAEAMVETLSGGNRQKVVLARWLYTKSKLLIFDEPTAGIDVGVKYEIYNLMNQLVREGIGVMMISSDLSELLGICDRIVVMCNGRITGVLSREEATQEKILTLATSFK